ncbi:MAG: cell division protein FtsZ [Candidatus Latescibacterota bacterium]|nr:cell division protein FtsZ [Candidatus Latescibacterota bacterium]
MSFKIIENDHQARIKVVGIGGAGGNAINRMIHSGMHGVEFIAINTDAQVLDTSQADGIICIGDTVTRGLGAGADPEVGRQAIEEDREKVVERLGDADLVFITAGMGGGTGTGAAPVVAEICREQGALAVGIVTEPFSMEGFPRMRNAQSGLKELQEHVDTLIAIKNQRLLSICGRDTTLDDAFYQADEILLQATRGIADLITVPGMINLDFNDVKTIVSEGGDAIMGVGTHKGEERATEAARKAIQSPLLEDVSINGAKGVLVNIAADSNLTLFEVNEAMSLIQEAAGQEANIIFGTVKDDQMLDEISVTVIATGFNLNGDADEGATSFRPEGRELSASAVGVEKIERDQSRSMTARSGFDELNKLDESKNQKEDLNTPTFLRRQKNG